MKGTQMPTIATMRAKVRSLLPDAFPSFFQDDASVIRWYFLYAPQNSR
jgi:hypothetical protein